MDGDEAKNELKFFYNDEDYITYEKHGIGYTAIVFLHGIASAKDSWYDLVHLLDKTKYTLYLLDLKGFGNSSIPKDKQYSVMDNADIVASFINRLIETEYIVVGNSFGGGVCLLLNTEDNLTKKPKAQILIDCAAYKDGIPLFVKLLRNSVITYPLFGLTTSAFRASFALNHIVFKDNITKQMIERYAYFGKGSGKHYSYHQTARQIVPSNDYYEKLTLKYTTIKLPTLIIWGREDKALAVSQGIRLHNQISHSKLEIIEKCGHIPQKEKPEQTYEIIENYLVEKGS